MLKEIEPCGFLYCVRTHIKYLNPADQIFTGPYKKKSVVFPKVTRLGL